MTKRSRYRKAKILAYPADWFWCFGAGFVAGVVVCLLMTRM